MQSSPQHSNISVGDRVVHSDYGRGLVRRIFWEVRQAKVDFDMDHGVAPRRVCLRDMVREPTAMPPARPHLTVVRS